MTGHFTSVETDIFSFQLPVFCATAKLIPADMVPSKLPQCKISSIDSRKARFLRGSGSVFVV